MAWTAPRTWVTGELVTASILNTHVRDNLLYLKAAPTFDGAIVVTGGITAGSGSVGIVDSTGKIPAISSMYFASLSAANLTSIPAGNLTGTIASATQDLITRTGTLVSGATGAGFTIALSTSTVTGSLADARLSANVPLLNAANTFSAANPIILGSSNNGTLRTDVAGYFLLQSGTTGFRWRDNGNVNTRMELSDAGVLTLPTNGTVNTIGAGGTSGVAILRLNGGSGTGLGAYLYFTKNGTNTFFIGNESAILGTGTSDEFTLYGVSGVGLKFYTNALQRWSMNSSGHLIPNGGATFNIGDSTNTIKDIYVGGATYLSNGDATQPGLTFTSDTNLGLFRVTTDVLGITTAGALRWGVNAAGDLIFGASSHIADSSGTPSIGSIGGTAPTLASGSTDYAFIVSSTGASNSSVTVTFGHTFTNVPAVTVTPLDGAVAPVYTVSTSQVVFTSPGNSRSFHCHARGF